MIRIFILALALLTGCAGGNALQTRANATHESMSVAERAEELAKHITRLEDIDKASVAITGNTAIVGIGVAGGIDDQKLMRLKSKVEKEVKRIDPSLTNVAVTAAAELVERINDLADSIVTDDNPPETSPELENIIENLTPPI